MKTPDHGCFIKIISVMDRSKQTEISQNDTQIKNRYLKNERTYH